MAQRELEEEERKAVDISAEDFAKVDFSRATLVDLRDDAQRLLGEIEGSVNVPLKDIGTGLADLPRDRPVYVYCNTGDFSAEIADLLVERGYEAYNVVGGFKAYQRALAEAEPLEVDARGLRCPGPIVKVADTLADLQTGQRIRVQATEDAFASDIRVWCDRTGNALESLDVTPDVITAVVRKGDPALAGEAGQGTYQPREHEKTFVVFSGDLDKTIAAFIMANGGAAMGRNVTMFFTFWGLNILRRPEKVRVQKNFVERMFGAMMPRGTLKLGLSRMNMLGAGPKMIRWLMREKGISSLEELIDEARAHGVRIVACQMSMDIMGIRKEELIDGVELGGVATMLGSAEKSDLTYFI